MRVAVAISFLILVPTFANQAVSAKVSPSFNCSEASAPDEHAICSDPHLAELDNLAAAGFTFVRLRYGKEKALSVARPLLKLRQACGSDPDCIRQRQVDTVRTYQGLGAPITLPSWAAYEQAQNTQDLDNLKSVTFLRGKCRFQLIAGFFPCKDAVMWGDLKTGGAFLTFIRDETMFSLAGRSDRQPNLENYYLQINRFRIYKNGELDAEDTGMEGECHFRLNKDASQFYFLKCDIYNRAKGTMYNFYLDPITSFESVADHIKEQSRQNCRRSGDRAHLAHPNLKKFGRPVGYSPLPSAIR